MSCIAQTKGQEDFLLALSFCSFQLEYGRWVALGAVFSTEKRMGGRRVLALERGGKRHPPRAPWHDAWRLKLNVVRNILFWAFWSAVEYNK